MFAFIKKRRLNKEKEAMYMDEVMTAAQDGDSEAQHCLGLHYLYGTNGFRQNKILALQWLHSSAEQNYELAFATLAHAYLTGHILEPSDNLFIKWGLRYLESIHYGPDCQDELGDAFAQQIGVRYLKGEGIEQNFQEAVKWLSVPAQKGDETAQFQLGMAFYSDESPLRNQLQAVDWFSLAAGKGCMDAQRALGLCFLLGEGVEADIDAARYWFTQAAEQGDEAAWTALRKYC